MIRFHYIAAVSPATQGVIPTSGVVVDDLYFIQGRGIYKGKSTTEVEQFSFNNDASTSAKGIVQLSSATNSTSTTLAATASAVKAAYDLASGKWTAVDASTSQKGIVKLTNSYGDQSETLAVTQKALYDAYYGLDARATDLEGYFDNSGKLVMSALPDAILGQVLYGGTVDGAGVCTLTQNFKDKYGVTSLTLSASFLPKYEGAYFIASADGASGIPQSLGVVTGDWIISHGDRDTTTGQWTKIDNTDAVSSVAGLTGVISAASLKSALSLGTAAYKAATTSVGSTGSDDNLPTEKAVRSAITSAIDSSIGLTGSDGDMLYKDGGAFVHLSMGLTDAGAGIVLRYDSVSDAPFWENVKTSVGPSTGSGAASHSNLVSEKAVRDAIEAAVGAGNPMTAAGDMVVGGTNGAMSRLAKGNQYDVLRPGANGATVAWEAPQSAAIDPSANGYDANKIVTNAAIVSTFSWLTA